MRRLTKAEEPDILRKKGALWTAAYVAADSEARKKLERWRAKAIREALNGETSGKCAYCETSVRSGAFMHVEHIVPKAIAPERAHIWDNLTWICPECNTAKSDYHSPAIPLVDPYQDDIDEHLVFDAATVLPEVDSVRGEMTVDTLDLNRPELMSDKVKRITTVLETLRRWKKCTDDAEREFLERGIRSDAVHGTYTAAVASVLKRYGFPL